MHVGVGKQACIFERGRGLGHCRMRTAAAGGAIEEEARQQYRECKATWRDEPCKVAVVFIPAKHGLFDVE